MSLNDNLEKILLGVLEKEMFKEGRQQLIKSGVKKLENGDFSATNLLTIIVNDRADIIEKLLKSLMFYFKHVIKQQDISKFVKNEDIDQIKDDLREKNEFLTLIGSRINNLCEKLKSS